MPFLHRSIGNEAWSSFAIDFKTSSKNIINGGINVIRSGTVMAATIALAAVAATLASGSASAETYAYVGNADSNDISVFRFDAATGEMIPVQTAAFVGVDKAGSSTPLAVSPDKKVLIAGVRSQPFQAESFAIDAKTGQLTHLGNGPLADSMANIAFDRTGKFLFSASYGGNKVAVNPVQPSGVVA